MKLKHIPMKGVYQHKLGHDDRRSLKPNGLPAVISEVGDIDHLRIYESGDL
jgi:hypothetical protein